jgi:hypothetical protein
MTVQVLPFIYLMKATPERRLYEGYRRPSIIEPRADSFNPSRAVKSRQRGVATGFKLPRNRKYSLELFLVPPNPPLNGRGLGIDLKREALHSASAYRKPRASAK